jgi:threonine dehydrogenase-like Zn-dependent dehydrogenase
MCRNGQYTERGIKARHGYGSERWRVEPDFVVPIEPSLGDLGVLTEPASVVAKAWDHIERIGARTSSWSPGKVLVTGAGPIGLLATLLAVQRGLDVHVLEHDTDGPKPGLVRDLGATCHSTSVAEACPDADVIIECTGAPEVVLDVVEHNGPAAVVCLTGVSTPGRRLPVDAGKVNRDMVLENDVVFGSVNANRRHYEDAGQALAKADPAWLARLVTARVPLSHFEDAFQKRQAQVKVVLDLTT